MTSIDEILKKKVYNFFCFLFIISIFFHRITISDKISYLKISELIFTIFFLCYIILDSKKLIKSFSKEDIIFLSWPILNIIQYNFNNNNLYGVISSIYIFTIYFLFKNLFKDLGEKKILEFFIIALLISSLISIVGWLFSQIGINLNLTEYKEGWPIYILDRYRSHGFMPTPNMLFFFLSIGFLFIFEFKFKYKKIILSIILLGILFTLSKSLVIFLPLIALPHILFQKNLIYKNILFIIFFFIFIFFNLFSNFIIAPKKINFFEGHKHQNYMMNNSNIIYENTNVSVYKSNYLELKIKSIKIIKDNFLIGIGFDNFKNYNINGLENILGYKPHSTILGLLVENGIFALIIFLIIFTRLFIKNLKRQDYFSITLLIFILIESINMDVHNFKIIWILIPFLLSKNRLFN